MSRTSDEAKRKRSDSLENRNRDRPPELVSFSVTPEIRGAYRGGTCRDLFFEA